MTPKDRLSWRSELKKSSKSKLDAPSWLWSSVVELASLHEAAFWIIADTIRCGVPHKPRGIKSLYKRLRRGLAIAGDTRAVSSASLEP
jgi:hypothetical protein